MTKKKKYGKVQVKNFKWIYAFLLPTIIIFVMFYVQPIVVMLTTSFTKWDGFNDPAFNGISNYIKLFTNSASAASIKNLILWSVIAMTFHVGFGVLTAFVLYLKPHGWKFTRSVFMIPNIISAAAWALIYRFIFNDQMGVLNSVIRVFDKDFSVQWFYQSPYAFWAVTLTWLFYAVIVTLIVLNDLMAIPKELIEAAQAVEKAGAFMLVLEGIPEKLAAIITKKVHIPTIGIGASAECDGQVLVYQDMLAMYGNFVPKFVKQFAQVGEVMQGAVKDYIKAVKEGTFPGPENTYAISDDVIEKLY